METPIAWAAMTLFSLVVVLAATRGVEIAAGLTGPPSARFGWWLAGACALGLLVLGVLYQIEGLAEADGRFLDRLTSSRGESLVGAFRVITTMGDVVPCFALAAVLVVWLTRQPQSGLWPLILPLLVLLEVALQFGYDEVFSVLTVTDVFPEVSIDGSGSIPSGSTARLMSLGLVACMIYQRSRPGGGLWLVSLGSSLVMVEITTRLYLGRHLVGDVIGGVLLGVILALLCALLMRWSRPGRGRLLVQ